MGALMEFAVSSNGDRWFLGTDPATEHTFVLHLGNPSSGGHETRTSVETFLNRRPFGPEREAIVAMLSQRSDEEVIAEKTPSVKLAYEYLRLGGRRRAKVDDNIISTRQWEDEPAEATAYWKEQVEPLDEKQRHEVEIHLPSISDD